MGDRARMKRSAEILAERVFLTTVYGQCCVDVKKMDTYIDHGIGDVKGCFVDPNITTIDEKRLFKG